MALSISNIYLQKCYTESFIANSYFPLKTQKFSTLDIFLCTIFDLSMSTSTVDTVLTIKGNFLTLGSRLSRLGQYTTSCSPRYMQGMITQKQRTAATVKVSKNYLMKLNIKMSLHRALWRKLLQSVSIINCSNQSQKSYQSKPN